MDEPVWVKKSVVLAVHLEQLTEHGGPSGLRDEGLLESALARPKDLIQYGNPDLAALAAEYAVGLARDHPFIDGNKRVSYAVTRLFLRLNGADLAGGKAERVSTWLSVASGEVAAEALAIWLRERIRQL